jgi:hypothetical protein
VTPPKVNNCTLSPSSHTEIDEMSKIQKNAYKTFNKLKEYTNKQQSKIRKIIHNTKEQFNKERF